MAALFNRHSPRGAPHLTHCSGLSPSLIFFVVALNTPQPASYLCVGFIFLIMVCTWHVCFWQARLYLFLGSTEPVEGGRKPDAKEVLRSC